VLIATGARPVPLTFRCAGYVITSNRFLELERLPARIVMVGGGYIAAEFSRIAARAGVKVTVLQRAERMLTRFEPELVGWLMKKFGEIGVEVRTGTAVEAIDEVDGGFRVLGRVGSEPTRSTRISWCTPPGAFPISISICPPPGLVSKMGASLSTNFSRASPIRRSMRPVTPPPKGRR
jgi:pyruvate/2-oxoglutarate dehydrogenase complex dihydrolipoamide dehydrogenase (E3) component